MQMASSRLIPLLRIIAFSALFTLCLAHGLLHAQTPTGRRSLAILPVKVTPSLERSLALQGEAKLITLGRATESLDGQLIDSIQQLRRFNIIARSDVREIVDDQDFQSIFSQNSNFQPNQYSITGAEFLLTCTVDDYQDIVEELRNPEGQVLAARRDVKLSVVVKLWHSETGELLESANFQMSSDNAAEQQANVSRTGDENFSELIVGLTRSISGRVATRILDVVYPARILARTGDVVTFSRGEGTGVVVGQPWRVFARGEELRDPDTGEVLGVEEIDVGMVRVISITPTLTRATVVEDYGVEVGANLRRVE